MRWGGARGVSRRLFQAGSLKATIAAGVVGRMSILDVLAAARTPDDPHDGRPRHCRMARVASGGWIAARIRIRPPQS